MDIDLKGAKDLEKALMSLKAATGKSTVRRVLKRAAQPFVDEANRLAPENEGDLSESYVVGTRLNRGQRREAGPKAADEVVVHAGTNNPAGVQQEFGNSRHPAQPHARPAWDAKGPEALRIVIEDMAAEINKAVARAAKRAAKG